MTTSLTPEQRAIVRDPAPISLVIAGPGTGKTTTLMAKAAAASKHLKPGQLILMTTHANSTADELEQRVTSSYPPTAKVTEITTLHAFGYQIITTYYDRLGYAHPPQVLPQNLTTAKITQAIDGTFGPNTLSTEQKKALVKASKQFTPQTPLTRQRLIDQYPQLQPIANKSLELIKHHQAQELQDGHVTFRDQLTLALALLRKHPEIRRAIRRRYSHLLVDEFQDLSPPQLKLIKVLASLIPNVMVAGDEAQAIYGFMGASPDVFSVFQQAFPKAQSFQLTYSHRCSQPTLDLANPLRATMQHVTPLTLVSQNTTRRGRPLYLSCTTWELQPAAVLQVYRRLTEVRGLAPHKITILARNRISLLEVHCCLEINGIPALIGTRQLLEVISEILQQLLAVMEDQPADLDAVLTYFGLASHHAAALRTLSTTTHRTLKYLIRKIKLGKQCRYYDEKLNVIADCLKKHQPSDKVFITAYINQLKRLTETSANLTAVQQVIRQYQQNHAQTVTLNTIHSFKGGENDAVLIVDLVDGHFPDKRTLDGPLKTTLFEEEKRLLYVGITRPKRFLCLISAPFSDDHHRSTHEDKAPKCSLLNATLKSQCITRSLTTPADVTRLFPLN